MTFPSDPLLGVPQADGDSTPVYDLGTLPQEVSVDRHFVLHIENGAVKQLVHAEKSGPAFYRPEQPPVKAQLEHSLQAQALRTAGEVLSALRRCVLLDLCASWPRLLAMAGVTSCGARRYGRAPWQWTDMRESVEMALCYAENPSSLKWQEADALIRGYALSAAVAIESRLGNPDSYDPESRGIMAGQAAVYRAFAEGRDR